MWEPGAVDRLLNGLPTTNSLRAWFIAALAILAGCALKPLLELPGGEPLPPYITLYPAVVLSALIGGPLVGVSGALASLILAWFLFLPADPSAGAALRLTTVLVFLLTGSFLGFVVGHARLALDSAIATRRQQEYAARESVHRIKNLIAVVQAIISKVYREVKTTDEYRNLLRQRLAGLDLAQQVLVRRGWGDTPIDDLIASALAPFLPNPGLTLVRGPEVKVPSAGVTGLSMALYELCTNAMKYGALAEGRGPVTLSWSTDGEDVVLEWKEKTPADSARIEGFGSILIRASLAQIPAGRVDYRVDDQGVSATFRWRDGGVFRVAKS